MLTPASRFATLLRREWLQHRMAWMIIVAAPSLIGLLVLLVGQIQLNVNDADFTVQLGQVPALPLAAVAIVGTGALTLMLAWAAVLIQIPSLARRDHSDRSVEFWLSLPVSHSSALAAPLVAHLLLFPLAALGIGMLTGHALSLLLVARFLGPGEWFTLPWGTLALGWISVTLRLSLGLVLATLWLSPLILLVMAASAWLKRWGLPALIGSIFLLGNVLDRLFGNAIIWSLGRQLFENAGRSFISMDGKGGLNFSRGADASAVLGDYAGWAVADGGRALAALADPLFVAALAVAAGGFALLVLRRKRGG